MMVYLLTLFSDIEECLAGNHTCSSDAKCINNNGSYNCSCKAGFVGDGRNCSGQISLAYITFVF